MAQIGVWARVMAVTDLPDSMLRDINIEPCSDIQTAIDTAIEHVRGRGERPRIVFLPSGSLTVPVPDEQEVSGGWVRIRTDVGIEDVLEVLDVIFEG